MKTSQERPPGGPTRKAKKTKTLLVQLCFDENLRDATAELLGVRLGRRRPESFAMNTGKNHMSFTRDRTETIVGRAEFAKTLKLGAGS